jgi:hypothetical protein
MQSNDSRKIEIDRAAKTLDILKPVLQNPHRVIVEKVLKIYEIINT